MAIKQNKSVKSAKSSGTKKIAAIPERQTKIEILQALANRTNLSTKEVRLIFTELHNLIAAHLKKNGSGSFIVPGVGVKITRRLKNQTKTRHMISPLTGKEAIIEAKPARLVVKIKALKQLQALVNK